MELILQVIFSSVFSGLALSLAIPNELYLFGFPFYTLLAFIPLYLICAWGIYLSNVGRPLGRLSWYLFPIIFVNFANYLDSVPIKIRRLITISLIIIVFSFRLGVYWMSDMSSQADLIYYYKFFWQ